MKTALTRTLLAGVLLLLLNVLHAPTVQAQFFDDSQFEEDDFQEDDGFFESYDSDFTRTPGSSSQGKGVQEDYSEGSTYKEEAPLVPSSQTAESLTAGGRTRQLTLQGDKRQLPMNMAWGAGTGLMIGGWFAMINEGDNRQTQRTIGTGIVLGIFLGAGVGMRSLLVPTLPRAASLDPGMTPDSPPGSSRVWLPQVALQDNHPMVGFRLLF